MSDNYNNWLAKDHREKLDTIRKIMTQAGKPGFSQQIHGLAQKKFGRAIDRLIDMLPYRLAEKISVVRFGPDGSPHKQFEVCFIDSGKVVTFDNIDTFPTDADIARLCVEAP